MNRLLIPVQKVILEQGCFSWMDKPVLSSVLTIDNLPLQQLQKHLKQQTGLDCSIVLNALGPAAVRITRDRSVKKNEAYCIKVTPNGIEILSNSDPGAYYAIQTLCDLITLHGRTLPSCIIDDAPTFARRGVYHDCSRGKVPTLDTLKQLVERLAHWKINELQLYIENVFTFTRHPDIGKGFSPFSPEDILSLQDHCKKHHIRLVGSLASFGHFEKILTLPSYSHLGEMPGFRNLPGGTTLCPIDPGSIKLVEELYEEFVPLFEAEDFNACCDETWELGKGRSKKNADSKGTGQVYLNFLLKIYGLCQNHGKQMNIWADILLKYPDLLNKLPRDIVLLNWEYEQDGPNIKRTIEIAAADFEFMVCPGTSSWLTNGSRMPNSIQNVREFAKQGRKHNAAGLLMTDWGDQGHRNFLGVSLHGFAHGAAHAWNTKDVDDESFTERFCYHVFGKYANSMAQALKLLGTTYITCGATTKNRSLLFDGLTEPLISKKPLDSAIDKMHTEGLTKIIEQLSERSLWPKREHHLAEFEKITIKELKLAAHMDCFAAQRSLIAKRVRRGVPVSASEFRRLFISMEDIVRKFKQLWLDRNRPSRLNDNLKIFKKTQKQTLDFIK